ncbi:MAG: hypothetical protein IJ560_04485 [Alphaproteobacteria bacterium]|nr:hypothetical protein [Alphaproteobacteria bacterium]
MVAFITITTCKDLVDAYRGGYSGTMCVFSVDFNKTSVMGARIIEEFGFYDFIKNAIENTMNALNGANEKMKFISDVLRDIGEHMQFRDAQNILFYGMRNDVFRSGSIGGYIVQNFKVRVGRYRGDGFTMENFVPIDSQIVYSLVNFGFDNIIFNFGRDHFSDTNPLHRYLLEISENLNRVGYVNFAPVAERWRADGDYMAQQRQEAARRKKLMKARWRNQDGAEFWRQKHNKK